MSHSSSSATTPFAPVVGEVEAFLRELIGDLAASPAHPPRRGRPPILPALVLWAGLLVCVLHGCSSQLRLWRLLTQFGLWDFPRIAVSDQAVYKRLATAGTRPLERLFLAVNGLLGARLEPFLPQVVPELAPFATAIVAIDETTFDPVARRLPARDGAPPATRRLPGKLAGVFDIRRQQWQHVQVVTDPTQNEKVVARELLATLSPGTLLLCDLGYFGFEWLDDLTSGGYWYVTRLRQRTSFTRVHTFAEHGESLDALVWLGAHRADRARYLVRLIQYRHGPHLHQYLTNVRDPERLASAAVVHLYARRWDIEMAVQLVKQHLGLSLWWSTKDVVIQQQLFAVLIIAQIVQSMRLEIAARAEVDLFDVSLPLLVQYVPWLAARGEDPIAVFVERGRAAGFIRPSRRTRYTTPDPPLAPACSLQPLAVERTPRYAQRNCGPRHDRQTARRN